MARTAMFTLEQSHKLTLIRKRAQSRLYNLRSRLNTGRALRNRTLDLAIVAAKEDVEFLTELLNQYGDYASKWRDSTLPPLPKPVLLENEAPEHKDTPAEASCRKDWETFLDEKLGHRDGAE